MGSFPKPLPPECRAMARHLYETTSLSAAQIARRCGAAAGTVKVWARRLGWERPEETPTPDPCPAQARTPDPPPSRKKSARTPRKAEARRALLRAVAETAEEARRQVAALRACPPQDAAERERHARTMAAHVRTLRQSRDLLAGLEPAAPRAAPPKQVLHDGPDSPESGRSLAELRDEFVRLLARAFAEEHDRRGPGGAHGGGAGAA